MSDRVLSQDEIDNVFKSLRDPGKEDDVATRAIPYDFRRTDRLAKDQVRSIHVLHENFARALGSSLSAYLRNHVSANLVSVEQLSFTEFSRCLSTPTCAVSLALSPYEGNALLELSPALVFPLLEMLLGGSGKGSANIEREITEIEKSILDNVFRIVLQDLRGAWSAVTEMDFIVDSYETGPQILKFLAPNEAVVAVSLEIRIGEHTGLMNIGIPSIVIKMLRQKFSEQGIRKSQGGHNERSKIQRLMRASQVTADVRLNGTRMLVQDLMEMEPGDILTLDHPMAREIEFELNGMTKYMGHIVAAGTKRAFQITRGSNGAD